MSATLSDSVAEWWGFMSGISVGDAELMLTDPCDVGMRSIAEGVTKLSSDGSVDHESFHMRSSRSQSLESRQDSPNRLPPCPFGMLVLGSVAERNH